MLLLLQPFFKMHLHLIHKIKMSVWMTWPSRMAKFSGSHGFVRTRPSLNTRHDLRLCREIDGVGGLLVNFFPDPDRIQFRVRVDNLDLIIRLGSRVFEGWLGRGRWPSRNEKKYDPQSKGRIFTDIKGSKPWCWLEQISNLPDLNLGLNQL